MPATQWDNRYEDAYAWGLERIQRLPGVACAFHSVIDGVIRLTPDFIQPVLESDATLRKAALEGARGEAPAEILTPAHFIQGLFYSVKRGAALQRMIRSEEVYRWALETFGHGELRLGGTSANMARSLAPLSIPVTVYANPLTRELAELFGDFGNLSVIAREGQSFARKRPIDAADERGVFAIHWIFEYGTDFVLELEGERIQPHRANRYIPSWNPRNNQFKMDPVFAAGFETLLGEYSHLLFSGFHIVSESYPDGQTCEDVVAPLGEFLDRIKQKAPELKIHLEFASIASRRVRQAVIDFVFPHIDSIGLNETELPLLLENLNEEALAAQLRESPSTEGFTRACLISLGRLETPRIHFHNLGYYLCVERKPWNGAESTRDALLFAAIMAAARAQNGLFTRLDDIAAGRVAAVAELGLRALDEVAHALNLPLLRTEGVGEYEGVSIAMIPTRLVQNPLFTVGLGDTISAGAFLTE